MITHAEPETLKVLLIEDNPRDVRLIQEYLSEPGLPSVDIEAVDHLAMGLKRLAEGGIDVILLDLGLPDSQWDQTFGKVQEQAQGAPIVVLSGLNHQAHALELMR